MLASLASPRKTAWRMSASPNKTSWRMWASLASPNIFQFWGILYFPDLLNSPNLPNLEKNYFVAVFLKNVFDKYWRVWLVLAKLFVKCWQVWRVLKKLFGKSWPVLRVLAKLFGECWPVWQVSHISKKAI